jgi:hypothetical protein
VFAPNSRYAKMATYTVTQADGRVVTAVKTPLPSPQSPIGYHLRIEGDRLDLLAARYLNDPTWFWKLCDANGSVSADALNARFQIGIPPGAKTG